MQEIHDQAHQNFDEWQKKAREHDAKDGEATPLPRNRHERRKEAALKRRARPLAVAVAR